MKFKFHNFSILASHEMFRLNISKYHCRCRNYSTPVKNGDVSAAKIRKTFLDYFVEYHNHRFIRSSPVAPFCDPTVPFVNAGMNQVCLVIQNTVIRPPHSLLILKLISF